MAPKITASDLQKEGRRYRLCLEARDGNRIWTRACYTVKPDQEWIDARKTEWLEELAKELEYEANPMDREVSDDDELRDIINAMVKWVRALQAAKEVVSSDAYIAWFNKEFPDTLYSPDRIMKFVKEKLEAETSEVALTILATYKFRDLA